MVEVRIGGDSAVDVAMAVAAFITAGATVALLIAAVWAGRRVGQQIRLLEAARKDALLPFVDVMSQELSAEGALTLLVANVGAGPALGTSIDVWLQPSNEPPPPGGLLRKREAILAALDFERPHFRARLPALPSGGITKRASVNATEDLPVDWLGEAGAVLVHRIAYQNVYREDIDDGRNAGLIFVPKSNVSG